MINLRNLTPGTKIWECTHGTNVPVEIVDHPIEIKSYIDNHEFDMNMVVVKYKMRVKLAFTDKVYDIISDSSDFYNLYTHPSYLKHESNDINNYKLLDESGWNILQ